MPFIDRLFRRNQYTPSTANEGEAPAAILPVTDLVEMEPQPLPPLTNTEEELPEIPEDVFIEKRPPINEKTINPKTRMDPQNATQKNDINVLYDFLEQNLEQKGYDDALMNPDMTHMNENLDILKRHCNIIIDKVKVYYNAQLKTADFHIESRKRNGMVDTVEELMMHKEILLDEMKRVQEIEADARNEQGHILALLGTYSKGFKNGYSAITFTNVLGNR